MISYDNIIAMQVTGYMIFLSALARYCKLQENNFHQASHGTKFFLKSFGEMDPAAEGI
jgi:hypothetical protein